MFQGLFGSVTEKEKDTSIRLIIQHASPRPDYFLMLILSIAMAAFGILLNDTVILLASTLIAPLLYPLLSLALGIITSDESLLGRSIYTLFQSIGIALVTAFVIGILFAGIADPETATFAVTASGQNSLGYIVVAVIAGFAAAFAITKKILSETMPGVAIAVALIPPLAFAGVGIAMFNWSMISTAFLLFMVNVIGVVFSSMIVFALLDFSAKRKLADEILEKETEAIDRGQQERFEHGNE